MEDKSIVWNNQKDFPEELNPAQNNFSVDVLIFNIRTNEHTIGWFDFNTMTWRFLSNESQSEFCWRYFENNIDIPEMWLDVIGYEGFYKVSNFGKVFSEHTNKLLSPFNSENKVIQ